MLGTTKAFSGFAVDDIETARRFYGETLGLTVSTVDEEHGLLSLDHPGDHVTLIYPSPGMTPPSYTILNFPVDDIDAAVDGLAERGVEFERYEGFAQDDKGIARGPGPKIAWFKDPAGNTLSVLEQP
jgi:catechol 2,3-dioxygenase-like lactoylglutathione lyase family enzyme